MPTGTYNIGDILTKKFQDNEIAEMYKIFKIDLPSNTYHLRAIYNQDVVLESAENLDIFYVKKQNT
jgi:hypothetical protein